MRLNVFAQGDIVTAGLYTVPGGTMTGPLSLTGTMSSPLAAVNKQYVDNALTTIDSANITVGTFPISVLPSFTGDLTNTPGDNTFTLNITGTAGTFIKPTVDSRGLVTGGGTLSSSDISSVSWSKITTGVPTTLLGFGITNAVSLNSDTTITDLTLNSDPVTAGHAATKQYVDGLANQGAGVSTGDTVEYGSTITPTGFLRCNGSYVSQTTYADLYAVIGDTYGTSVIGLGSGKPWKLQYDINTTNTATDITGWNLGITLPEPLGFSQAIVTSSRVYLLGGYSTSSTYVSTVYTAPINADGTLGSWTTGTSLPGPLGQSQAIVTSSRVYLLGGRNNSTYLSTVYTAPINADGTLGVWTTGTSLPGPLGQSQAIVTSSRVYLLGGINGSGIVSTVYTAPINADGTLGTWTTGTPLPGPLTYSQAIVTSSRVYLLGGYSGSGYVSTVYTAPINADGTLGTWTTGTSLPGPLGGSQAIVTSSRVYLLGGTNGSAWVSTVYTALINADGTLGAWTTGTSLPEPVAHSQAVVTSSRVYLLGGYSSGNTSTVYTAPINADGTLGTWTSGTSLPGPLGLSQAIVTSNRVYLLGGYSPSSSSLSTVYTAPINADGTLGTWTTGTSLPVPLRNSQAIVTSSRVYLLGGRDNFNYLSTVYTAPINADGTLGTWTTGTSLPGPLLDSQAIVTSSRVYLLGGFNGSAVSTTYTAPINPDGSLGTWTTGTSLPGPLRDSQAIVTSSRVYLLGGYNSSTVYTAPINADGTLGSWSYGLSLPGSLGQSQAIVTSSRVYLLGGYNSSTVYTAPINADGTLGTWTTGTSLPEPLSNSQVIVTSSRVYLLGGLINNTTYISTVYSAPFTGGLNNYISGATTPTGQFTLPDKTAYDNTTGLNTFIKT